MSKIDTTAWAEFNVLALFDRIERGKGSGAGSFIDGDVPYIAASFANNGYVRDIEDLDGSLTSDGNCIALICNGNGGIGRNTYQAEPFVGSGDLQLAYHSRLNQWNGMFLVACLDKSIERYNYSFAWKRNGEAFKAETVFLPATSTGDPDWDYMEQTMRDVLAQQEKALDQLSEAALAPENEVDTNDWADFLLPTIFDINMGSGLDFGKMLPSEADNAVLFVGRTGVNNGVMGCVEPVEGAKLYEAGALTVALGGSIGACFVQGSAFHTSQNVAVLNPKRPVSDDTKRFIAAAIQKESFLNYKAFVKELNAHLRVDFTLRLPIDAVGDPDWDYMEQTMQKVMAEREAALDSLQALVDEA